KPQFDPELTDLDVYMSSSHCTGVALQRGIFIIQGLGGGRMMDPARRKIELLKLQAVLNQEVRNLSRKSGQEDLPKDLGERSAFEETEARRLRNLNLVLGRRCGVEKAIQLLGQGWTGTCVDCDGEIPYKRIEVIPWATRCTTCADKKTMGPVVLHTRRGQKFQESQVLS
ncbi:MAG: hypothetical protein A2735_02680, partial [Candidatus Yanofskybacteria bacterium RIFCSPHIGHO2_01_FULL_41_21]